MYGDRALLEFLEAKGALQTNMKDVIFWGAGGRPNSQ